MAESMQDYPYFKMQYKLIAKDLSKKEALDAYLKALQRVNFTWQSR